jgi:2'-5' RNA ligase
LAAVRLFVALWPSPAVRDGIVAWRDTWPALARAARVEPGRVHLTLHFLGDHPVERVPELAAGLAVAFEPFELRMGIPQRWPRGLAVLMPERVPPRLSGLHDRLGDAVRRLGLAPERRDYRPHVTLARRADGPAPAPPAPGLRWRVRSYVLVASAGGKYTLLRRYR